MATCRSRQPGGVMRCDAEKGHDSRGEDHWADHPDGRVTWTSRRGEKGTRQVVRSRVNKESAKQAYRRGRLAGIRDERLAQQRDEYELQGDDDCNRCSQYPPPPGSSWCEHCGKATPPERLQLHHYVQRSLGKRATPEDMGDERPEQLGLICQGPGSCHDAEHD